MTAIIIHYKNIEDKIEGIINKFKNIIKEENNSLCYIFNKDKINEALKLNQIIKDKNEEKINILVYNNNKNKKIKKRYY